MCLTSSKRKLRFVKYIGKLPKCTLATQLNGLVVLTSVFSEIRQIFVVQISNVIYLNN